MVENVEFHAKLSTLGRFYIPKRLVELHELWIGTRVHVYATMAGVFKSIRFDTLIRSGFSITIPKIELTILGAKHGNTLKIGITKLEPPKTETEPPSN